jgi:hypothetical protein
MTGFFGGKLFIKSFSSPPFQKFSQGVSYGKFAGQNFGMDF